MGNCFSFKKAPSSTKSQQSQKFFAIADNYNSIEEVQKALRGVGLESSNLILGIDFTKSNTWTGEKSFGGKCLHHIDAAALNPYQRVISVVGRTLEAFDDDKLIPAYGFGDNFTTDKHCFPFFPDKRPSQGFEEVLSRYNEITPGIVLAGPTNFGPVIREAIAIVKQEKAYHILVIIADGQVTNRKDTEDAIVEASSYALSIIVVGVGDGPWDMMEEFDDQLPARKFDNFQFVPFERVMSRVPPGRNPDAVFAMHALMEIPEQFKIIRRLKYL
uniref:VWFA domain-containing protein n=1 Tax=Hanusia phi TaxID=3032 RepID=A0A7S0DYG3_9CRYP